VANRQARLARGEKTRGFKIGFTNRSIWERYGVSGPIFAPVWNTTVVHVSESTALDSKLFCQPRIEPEIVFGFSNDVAADASPQSIAANIEWAAHGFEIVHCHYASWKFSAADTIADFGLHGRLLVGPRMSLAGDIEELRSLSTARVQLMCNGAIRERGVATAVLGGPFDALIQFHELLRQYPQYGGIRAGDVVTTGTITDAHPIEAGQVWSTHLSETPLLGLEIRVV
jgi:2-keto-4-pentenoate hydratase